MDGSTTNIPNQQSFSSNVLYALNRRKKNIVLVIQQTPTTVAGAVAYDHCLHYQVSRIEYAKHGTVVLHRTLSKLPRE